MARPLSWLPRLSDIRRAVANSARSHYGRRDLETLFELQPRAAQKLLEMLPTLQVGTSRLVDREVLAGFLDRVRDAEDTAELLERVRAEKAQVSRKRPRSLVRHSRFPAPVHRPQPRAPGGQLRHRRAASRGDVCHRPAARRGGRGVCQGL